MSRNGELCLRKVIVTYSPSHGDPAMRQFLATHLARFTAKYPSVQVDLRPRLWPETAITGVYRDGSERSYRTSAMSSMGIWTRFHRLVNQANDHDLPFSASHLHFQRKSVQGVWNPWLWHYETHRSRAELQRWDRKLSEKEWAAQVEQYSAQMKREEQVIRDRIARVTSIPSEATEELARRWKEHVVPKLQTDVEFNIAKFKRDHKAGVSPKPVALHEYRLFSVPDHSEMGQDAVDMMRRREAKNLEAWWQKRKEQLKPPK